MRGITMKILFVIDNYEHQTNGTTITTKRFIEHLRLRGHEIRILSCGNKETTEGLIPLKERYIPIVTPVARKQDVIFSKPDLKIIEQALEGVDVVHFETPWKTSRVVRKIAAKKGIPTSASFHVQPENITYGVGLTGFVGSMLSNFLYVRFRKFYGQIPHIHAPSKFIAKELRDHLYPTKIHVISNGVSNRFFDIKNQEDPEKFVIVSTGRYAKEKNQDVIIKAIGKSIYKDQIKLILPGQGPRFKKLKKLAEKYQVDVEFGFKTQDELVKALQRAHLYVHAANIEIEAIACIEAIAAGLVPVIANAKKSATPQFAIDELNLFKPNDDNDLRQKIEYWFTNKEEKLAMKERYKSFTEKFRIEYSIDRFEEMLIDTINETKAVKLSQTLKGKVFSQALTLKPVKKTISAMTYYLFAVPLLFLYLKFILNVKYKNAKHLRKIKGGAVMISNHVHILDSAMNSLAVFPRRPIMTAEKGNFVKKYAGFWVSILGAVPMPENPLETTVFFAEMSKKIRQGRLVHVFPEGELIDRDKNIREFKRGAFKLAVESSVPVVPCRITFGEKKFLLWNRKQIVLNFGKPLYPDLSISSKDALQKLKEEAEASMNNL
jgi:1,2-diacylglycerol 3-alpha-glucosyltransferase